MSNTKKSTRYLDEAVDKYYDYLLAYTRTVRPNNNVDIVNDAYINLRRALTMTRLRLESVTHAKVSMIKQITFLLNDVDAYGNNSLLPFGGIGFTGHLRETDEKWNKKVDIVEEVLKSIVNPKKRKAVRGYYENNTMEKLSEKYSLSERSIRAVHKIVKDKIKNKIDEKLK